MWKLISENTENNGMQLSATTNWIGLLMCNLLGIGHMNTTNTGMYMLHTHIAIHDVMKLIIINEVDQNFTE